MMPHRISSDTYLLVSLLFFSALFYCFSLTNGIETAKWLYLWAMSVILISSAAVRLVLAKPHVIAYINSVDVALFTLYVFLLSTSLLFPSIELFSRNLVTCHVLFFYYCLLRMAPRQNTDAMTLISAAFISAGILQAGIALLQLYGLLPSLHPLFKLTGTFANPDALAGYLTSITPFAFGLYLLSKDQTLK